MKQIVALLETTTDQPREDFVEEQQSPLCITMTPLEHEVPSTLEIDIAEFLVSHPEGGSGIGYGCCMVPMPVVAEDADLEV